MGFISFDVSDKKVLVTGAIKGIRRSIALTLARAGADVIATAREEKLKKLISEIKSIGREAV